MNTTFGWDASDFDWPRGPMDLAAAYRDGIRFFTHKATEGTGTQHKHYGTALNRARAAGIPVVGAYHVVRSRDSVDAQLRYLLDYVTAQTPWWSSHPYWMWQVDCERWPYDNVSATRGHDFAAALAGQTGKRVVLYASKGQYADGIPAGTPLWNAHYGSNPSGHYKELYPGDGSAGWATYSGQTPKLLQFGSRLHIGTQSTCDANAFRGSLDDLLTWVNPHHSPTPPPKPPTPHPPKPKPPAPKGHKPGSRQLQLENPHLSGDDVLFVQHWIGALHCGKADGDFGDHTRTGVVWYQRMQGLTPDGVVGPKTWGRMGVRFTG